MISPENCQSCGGKLTLDQEETRKDGIVPIYVCNNCSCLYCLKKVGEKPREWKTKNSLAKKKED